MEKGKRNVVFFVPYGFGANDVFSLNSRRLMSETRLK